MHSVDQLTFRWEKRGDRYVFRCDREVQGDLDKLNDQLADMLRWCKAQKLRPD
jgi:hypothetical protein